METTAQGANDSRTLTQNLIPVLQRFDKENGNIRDIHVTKNQFTIGRARDNDEVICSMVISRHHCMFECDENEEWSIKNLSINGVYINGQSLGQNQRKDVTLGDVVQLSAVDDYRYFFTLRFKDEIPAKRRKVQIPNSDNNSSKENTFINYQESKRKEMEEELASKRKENEKLKLLLNEYSNQQEIDDDFITTERIECLKKTINSSERMGKIFEDTYNHYLTEMNNEKNEFDSMIKRESQKLQTKININNEQVERIISDKIEKWQRENQCKWSDIIKNFMREEKIRQEKMESENLSLVEKLKKTEDNLRISEDALREKTALVKQLQQINETKEKESKILKNFDDEMKLAQDYIREKVENILDEQLSCSICSEILINPTSLSCSHTFCEYCIISWKRKSKRAKCPICRKKIRSMNRSHVFDSLIDKMISEFSAESIKRRNEVIDERKCT